MARLISQRYTVLRPHLSGPQTGPGKPSPKRPGRRAGVVMDRKPLGLGDWVETWAKPIAGWIDVQHPQDPALHVLVGLAVRARLVTLPIGGCSACSRRRALLNYLVPELARWSGWRGAPRRLFSQLAGRLQRPGKRR